jgi:hypothetical protein
MGGNVSSTAIVNSPFSSIWSNVFPSPACSLPLFLEAALVGKFGSIPQAEIITTFIVEKGQSLLLLFSLKSKISFISLLPTSTCVKGNVAILKSE